MARWLGTLDKKVERYSTGSHEDYRVFMSAEPAPSPESHIIPQGILENAIKITNEPPTGMYANLHKALDLFTQVRRLPLPCTPAPVPGLSSPGDPGRMEPLGLQSQGQTLSSEGAPRWLPPTQAPHARRHTRTHVSNRSRRAPGRPQVAVGAPVTHGCVKRTPVIRLVTCTLAQGNEVCCPALEPSGCCTRLVPRLESEAFVRKKSCILQ